MSDAEMNVLILGGTGFIGPYYVRAALARGHHVAVFNRGKADAELPADVERLVGDRGSNLESIKHRDWDAVIDLSTYGPAWVKSLGEALRERVKHYTFISTIAVYENYRNPRAEVELTENSKLLTYEGGADPYSITTLSPQYGELKVLCECEAEQQFPGRVLILRPGFIVGPGEPSGSLVYWPARMQQSGEIMVAGEPHAPVQFIDARDLAEWTVRLIEKRMTGVYNAVGPAVPMSFAQMLKIAGEVVSVSPRFTWCLLRY